MTETDARRVSFKVKQGDTSGRVVQLLWRESGQASGNRLAVVTRRPPALVNSIPRRLIFFSGESSGDLYRRLKRVRKVALISSSLRHFKQ